MVFIKKNRNFILRIIDILIICMSYYLAEVILTNNIMLPQSLSQPLIYTMLIAIIVYQVILSLFRTYQNIVRYENGNDYLIYILACMVSYLIVVGIKILAPITIASLSVNIIAFLITTVGIISYRVVLRILLTGIQPSVKIDETKLKNILIIGAGSATKDIIKTIKLSMREKYNIVGIVDDNPNKTNYSISGIRILGTRHKIIEICKRDNVKEIFFAISKIDNKNRKAILKLCQETNAKVKMLPSTADLIKNKTLMENFKEIEIEDLLGREPIILDNNNIENLIKDSTIIVTGGGGSIGSELCRQIATYEPSELVIFDIYENNLYDIQMELTAKYPGLKLLAIVGSVRDKEKLRSVFKEYKPRVVFHAAAHKHVPLMEDSPLEAIKNNVLGTKNTVDIADEYGVEKFILVSTDKAVNPTNIMGASKRMCEMIIQTKNEVSKTDYVAVRFGNVLGSNGSVIPLFKKQIEKGGPITLTHKEITRYFMTIPEAVGLILQTITYAEGGEIFVLDMGEKVKIYDLAISLIKLSGLKPGTDILIEEIGLRPGEKLYEELLMAEEGLEQTKHKKIFIAAPLEMNIEEVETKIENLKKLIDKENEDISFEMIKNAIKEAVPTYKEPEEVNNK